MDERQCRNACVFRTLLFAALIAPGVGFGTPSAQSDTSTTSVSANGPQLQSRASSPDVTVAADSVGPHTDADGASSHDAHRDHSTDLVICSTRPPRYPPESMHRGEQGTVQVHVRVAANGVPIDTSIATSSGFARLDEAARKVLLQWTFGPVLRNGIAIEHETVVPITFSLDPGSPHRDDQNVSASGTDAVRRRTNQGLDR